VADGKRKVRPNSIVRMALVAVSLVFQIGWLLVRVLMLNEYSEIIASITGILVVVVVLYTCRVVLQVTVPIQLSINVHLRII